MFFISIFIHLFFFFFFFELAFAHYDSQHSYPIAVKFFSKNSKSATIWCIYIVVWTPPLLRKKCFPYDRQPIDSWRCLCLQPIDIIFHKWDAASKEPSVKVEMSLVWFWLKHMDSGFFFALTWWPMPPAACCLLQTIQQGFGMGGCICV